VNDGNLLFMALVGLPLAVAICLGMSVRSFVGRSRAWPLWLFAAAALGAVWVYSAFRTPIP
jgi:hypothetical protein